MEYFDFFTRIKEWVVANNTTIEALLSNATNKKVSKNVFYGWKRRASLPSGEFCYQLAKYMGVSTGWLISGNNETANSENTKYDELVRKIDCLTPEAISLLDSQIDGMITRQQKEKYQ